MIFVGSDMTREQLEVTGIAIDPIHRGGEPELALTRWWDYADWHPVRATYYFAHVYKEQTKAFCVMTQDINDAESMRAFNPPDIFRGRDATSMWHARRGVDAVGCPYPFALAFAQARALDRCFHRFPRPNQLHGEEFEDDLKTRWKETCARSIQYSKADEFKASARQTPTWLRHQEAVVAQITARGAPYHRLAARMLAEQVMDVDHVAHHYGAAVAEQAVEHARMLG